MPVHFAVPVYSAVHADPALPNLLCYTIPTLLYQTYSAVPDLLCYTRPTLPYQMYSAVPELFCCTRPNQMYQTYSAVPDLLCCTRPTLLYPLWRSSAPRVLLPLLASFFTFWRPAALFGVLMHRFAPFCSSSSCCASSSYCALYSLLCRLYQPYLFIDIISLLIPLMSWGSTCSVSSLMSGGSTCSVSSLMASLHILENTLYHYYCLHYVLYQNLVLRSIYVQSVFTSLSIGTGSSMYVHIL